MRISCIATIALTSLAWCACTKQQTLPVQTAAHASSSSSSAALVLQPAAFEPASETIEGEKVQLVSTDQKQGPFRIGGQTFTFVKHVKSIGEPKPETNQLLNGGSFEMLTARPYTTKLRASAFAAASLRQPRMRRPVS